jgi:hypothetical protein
MRSIILIMSMAGSLSACGFVSQQLADKAREEQLLAPGALDTGIASNFDEYQMKFLDRYRVRHSWPVTSACKYSQLRTKYKRGEISYGDVYIVDDIYEDEMSTKQREAAPTWNLDRFVRSQKRMVPIFAQRNGVIYAGETVGYEEKEEGLRPLCFQAWGGINQHVALELFKRTVPEWDEWLNLHSRKPWGQLTEGATKTTEVINGNTWTVYKAPLQPRKINTISGPYLQCITPVGDTGYSISLELGANQESLDNPKAFAAMEAMFRRLLESVKVDPLTPAIEVEIAQLKAKAIEVQRQECIEMAKRTKPFKWCQKYLAP